MMRFLLSIAAFSLLALPANPAFAQQSGLPPPGQGAEGSRSSPVTAVIMGTDDIQVGETAILDASASRLVRENVSYRWYVVESNQLISRSGEALYTPAKPGPITFRLIITSTVDGETRESRAEHTVVAYRRKILLITDAHVKQADIESLQAMAADRGDYVRVLRAPRSTLPLGAEDTLFTLLSRERTAFRGAETVIVWTEGVSGLQALVHAVQTDAERQIDLRERVILLISERTTASLSRIARGSYDIVSPGQIFISGSEALPLLITSETKEKFLSDIKQENIDLRILNREDAQFMPWDLLPALINYMLTHGVDSQTVILLLMLPVIATIFAFLKQVVGITSFGLYTPSIVTLSFLALGWRVGVAFLVFILLSGYLTRMFMRRWRLLYIPKVAIILTAVSATLLLLIAIGEFFGVLLAPNTVFILLIMSTLAENLLNVKLEEGWATALLGIGETIVGALACVFLVRWPTFQSLILAYPELLLLTVGINVFLGRWTGLRIVEYFRFREVFRHLQEE